MTKTLIKSLNFTDSLETSSKKPIQDNRWAWNSCRKPYFLWEKYPDMLHVEPQTFLPSWDQWEVSDISDDPVSVYRG